MRSFAVGLLSGLVMVVFTAVVWRWPVMFALGLAAFAAALAVVTTLALQRDLSHETDAWHRAAPDLVDPPAGPRDPGPALPD
jgi:hypothetical protein